MTQLSGTSLHPQKEQLARQIQRNIRDHEVQCFLGPGERGAKKRPTADSIVQFLKDVSRTGQLAYRPSTCGPDGSLPPAPIIERGYGDAGDLSIVVASLCAAVGNDAYVAFGGWKGRMHMWVVGRDESGAFILETTEPEAVRLGHNDPGVYGYRTEFIVNRSEIRSI